MENLSNLSDRLKELMFYGGQIRSETLARKVGVTGSTLRTYLNGTREMSLTTAIRLADCFCCSLDYLAGRTERYEEIRPTKTPDFYPRLRTVMAERGVSRYRIARDTTIKDSYFTRWKNGQSPRFPSVILLADYLDVTLDYLTGRTDF